MRCFVRDSGKIAECADGLARYGKEAAPVRRFRPANVARVIALAATVGVLLLVSAAPAMAITFPGSKKVALIPGPGNPPPQPPGKGGIMPTSQYVSGRPNESFDKFSFTSVPLNQITPAKLSQFDTVALIQLNAGSLNSAQRSALAQFVANGGKLIIHDADQTSDNDYSWILPGSSLTQVGAGCPGCGLQSGSAQITENSGLISANPADPSYVNFGELQTFTDAFGDANLLGSYDPRWFAAVKGTNGARESGALIAYASNNGLAIYNGLDTDQIDTVPAPPWHCTGQASNFACYPNGPHPSVDWLAQMWYSELNGSSTNGLPQGTPVNSIGTPVPPGQAGLPGKRACKANRTLFIRLKKLVHNHPKVIQIDVYLNGRDVLRERKGHWRNVTLTHLPTKNRSFTVKIVALTSRHYHLISKKKYPKC